MQTLYGGGDYWVFYVPPQSARPGKYHILWDGAGTIGGNSYTLFSGSLSSAGGINNSCVVTTTLERQVLGVSALGSPHITNIRFVHEDDVAEEAAGMVYLRLGLMPPGDLFFGKKFLARLREANFGVIRFLNVSGSNRNTATCFADITPLSYRGYGESYMPKTKYAGVTGGTGDAYTISRSGWTLTDKNWIMVQFDRTATGDTPTLDIEGTGAKQLVEARINAGLAGFPSTIYRPLAGRTGAVIYDEDLDVYILAGGNTANNNNGPYHGWPIEVAIELCNTVGAHCSMPMPHLALDPETDYVSGVATYARDHLNSGLKFQAEGPNECWNGSLDFFCTHYADAKEKLRSGLDGDRHQWYGRALSKIGKTVSAVFSADRTKYDVICGVQTVATPSSVNNRMNSARYVTETGLSTDAAKNWVTQVHCTGYHGFSQYGTAVEDQAVIDWHAAATQAEADAVVDTFWRDTGGSGFTLALLFGYYANWRAWIDGFIGEGFTIAFGQYEGGFSPDYEADADTNEFREACKSWPGLYQKTILNYRTFTETYGGIFPSVFQFSSNGNAWSVLDPNIWITPDPPQWTAIVHFNSGARKYSLTAISEVDPVITGNNWEGGTLSLVSNGTYRKGTPSGFTYRWKNNGVDISGETGSSYLMTAGDLGDTITCEEIATINGVVQAARASNALVGLAVPPVVAASNSGDISPVTSFNAPLPANIVAGNRLLLKYVNVNSAGAPTINTPSGWDLLGTETSGFSRLCIFSKIASGSEGATVTVTQGSGRPTSISYRITGHDAVQTPEVVFAAGSVNPPSLTPSWGKTNNLWIAGVAGDGNGTTTAPSYPAGYTDNQLTRASTNADGGKVSVATKTASAVSDDPAAFTGAVPVSPIAFTVAIKPA